MRAAMDALDLADTLEALKPENVSRATRGDPDDALRAHETRRAVATPP